jgi:thioredoxin-dependent peroxiredoxin
MAEITLKRNTIHTKGELPKAGSMAPDFKLTKTDLSDISLKDFAGKRVVVNIFPSLDTSVCAASVRRFNEEVEKLDNTVVLCASRDLPYAHKRFCSAEGLDNVVSLSELRDSKFGDDYNVRIIDGPMKGLLSRAVVVVDEEGKVIYTEQVPNIGQEPNYEAVVSALS